MRRIHWVAAVLGVAVCLAARSKAPDAAGSRVVVLTSSAMPAYAESLEGIRQVMGAAGQSPEVIDLDQAVDLGQLLTRSRPALVVTLGSKALTALAARNIPLPVISTMILDSEAKDSAGEFAALRILGRVYLNTPLGALLADLKQIFPGKTNLGILRGPSSATVPASHWQERAKEHGFTLQVAECAGPERLLECFESLKATDFVWCVPDGTLYNSATVRPLILASLRERIPIIGFSESFVRAGAALGLFPDFQDIGRQTGEMVLKHLRGQPVSGKEGPRKLKVAVNERVLRLLGLRISRLERAAGDFIMLR